MDSVRLNNTLQEDWIAQTDSGQQWSHCAVAPLYITFHGLLGLRPLLPGFQRVEWRPQLADLDRLEVTAHTVQGPMRFVARGPAGNREIAIEMPPACAGEIILRQDESVALDRAPDPAPAGHARYRLPSGRPVKLRLKSS